MLDTDARHDPRVRAILNAIADLAPESYLVGGVVRDFLMGRRDRKDLDVALRGDGFEIARQAATLLGKVATFVALDSKHGTGRVVLRGQRPATLDVTSFRASTLSEDLHKRDFTINAMALRIQDFLSGLMEPVLDPTGGRADLLSGTIRACSKDSFRDDAVRVLRAFRFMASLGFGISKETLEMVPPALEELPSKAPERIRDELIVTLSVDSSFPALKAMALSGVLETIFPELRPMKGCGQNAYHHLDVWDHSLETISRMENLLANAAEHFGSLSDQIYAYTRQEPVRDRPTLALLKLAALFHDSGKPASRFVDSKGKVRFFGHEKVSQEIFNEAGRRLKFASREIALVSGLIAGHMRPTIFTAQKVSLRAIHRLHSKYQRNVTGLFLLFLADLGASRGPARPPEAYERAGNQVLRALSICLEAEATPRMPLLNGRDLMSLFSIGPGPHIGSLLRKLTELQDSGKIGTREEALEAAAKILAEEAPGGSETGLIDNGG